MDADLISLPRCRACASILAFDVANRLWLDVYQGSAVCPGVLGAHAHVPLFSPEAVARVVAYLRTL